VTWDLFFLSVATALSGGTAVLIAATGELLVEKVGIYNIGIEGAMVLGALAAFVGVVETGQLTVGLLAGIAAGAATSLVFGLAVAVLRADMIVAGLAITFIGLGVSSQLGQDYARLRAPATLPDWDIPVLSKIPHIGEALFQHNVLVYVAFLLPFGVYFLLNHSSHGLGIRAIGENPAAADALGIGVTRWRVFYVAVGGAFAGLGGAFLTLGTIDTWLPGITNGQGWIALAIVIFAGWRPLSLIVGAYLFGALGTLGNVAQALGWSVPSEFFSALPYIGTLGVLTLLAWARVKRPGWAAWPAALGQLYARER
jgi:simple sugar transport system permease protein